MPAIAPNPLYQPQRVLAPAPSDDLGWLTQEADWLTALNTPQIALKANADTIENDYKAYPMQPSTGSALQNIKAAFNSAYTSSNRLLEDAKRLRVIHDNYATALATINQQQQTIAALQAKSGEGGTAPPPAAPTEAPKAGTGTLLVGIAALAAIGVGIWWIMGQQRRRPQLRESNE